MSSKNNRSDQVGRAGLPLLPTLLISIGLLVLLAVGSVVLLQWFTGRAIIQQFASHLIEQGDYTSELALRRHLEPAVRQATFVAEAFEAGRYNIADPRAEDFIAGSVAAAPQISVLILVDSGGRALRLTRDATESGYRLDRFEIERDGQLAEIGKEIREYGDSYWGAPVWGTESEKTYMNFRMPIRRVDQHIGFLAVAISTDELSVLAEEMSDPPRKISFMLYGNDRILAHPRFIGKSGGRSVADPLPSLKSFGDPVIANLPQLPPLDESGIMPPLGADAREANVDGNRYFIITRKVSGFGNLPITIGRYGQASAVDAPMKLFSSGLVVALVVLAVALVCTGLMTGAISRPIRRAATGAAVIGDLDFDNVAPLSRSIFREINDLARAFNSMLEVLKAFGRYVPRSLVVRLMKEGTVGAESEDRELAIMFTDIVGFTSTCEGLSAAGVAEFVNHHLALIVDCIEREGGTIDKYIGDAVMAFWGAPTHTKNPAVHACRAGIAIKQAITADNAERVKRGLAPVRIRVGIHFGRVVVGDIGAPSRINYTIVGDAVNSAQRLESLGKTVDPDAEVIILISREIIEELPEGFQTIACGAQPVKGRSEPLDVFRLIALDN